MPPDAAGNEPSAPSETAIAARRTQIHNEQTRIRATLLNTISAGLVVAGVVTPRASAAITGVSLTSAVFVLMAIWFVASIILHYGALLMLEALK